MSGFDAKVAAFSLLLLQAFSKVNCRVARSFLKAHLPCLCSSSSKLMFAFSLLKTPNANICFSTLLSHAKADIFLHCISDGTLYIALALSYELLNACTHKTQQCTRSGVICVSAADLCLATTLSLNLSSVLPPAEVAPTECFMVYAVFGL